MKSTKTLLAALIALAFASCMGGMKSKTSAHYNSKGEYSGSTTSNVANVFEFNVDEAVVEKVKKAMASGEPVRLVYREWALGPPTISNDHVVIDVITLQ